MIWALILLVLVLLGGIILLSAKSPLKKQNREEFLRELAKFLEGTLEPIGEDEEGGSFQIRFKFKNEEFLYEDLETRGFKGRVYKVYLRIKTSSKLTLTFTEKKRSTKIRSDIFIASEVSAQYMNPQAQLQVPGHLKDLKVFTNDISEANKILEDKRITDIFKKFKNVDTRGYPFLSLGIVSGVVILEFHSVKTCKPNISALREDMTSIDDYLEPLLVITHKLKEKS